MKQVTRILRLVISIVLLIGWDRFGGVPTAWGKGFIGVSYEAVDDLPKQVGSEHRAGLRVTAVVEGSPAEKAGITVDDIIVKIDDLTLEGSTQEITAAFSNYMKATTPEQSLRLKILKLPLVLSILEDERQVPENEQQDFLTRLTEKLAQLPIQGKLALQAERRFSLETVVLTLGISPTEQVIENLPSNADLRPDLVGWKSELETLTEQLVSSIGDQGQYEDVRQRLANIENSDDGFRLTMVRYLHRSPFAIEKLGTETLNGFTPQTTTRQELTLVLTTAARILDHEPYAFPFTVFEPNTLSEHLDYLENVLWLSSNLVQMALSELTIEERAFIEEHAPNLLAAFISYLYLQYDADQTRYQNNRMLIEYAKKVRWDYLYAAALSMARLHEPPYLESLHRVLARAQENPQTGLIARRNTGLGWILIGGSGNNVYREFNAAFIIDLGGDDIYHNNAAGATGLSAPVAGVVDFEGNDAYESTNSGAQGSGVLGVGILLDCQGDDSYVTGGFGQAVGCFGIGILMDEAGNDRYYGQEQCQGVGLWGLGLLIDREGNDAYRACYQAQGLGLPGGLGVIVDCAGDDQYYSKGRYPTNYGTPGVFDAWSQGCGLGFRGFASGGIGMVIDWSGADRYEAGNFAQGGGYYYGWGILMDAHGRDQYIGSRYNQGFSAHQAIGLFIEEQGDDFYLTRHAVAPGLAWDQCVTLFHDRGGNDEYRAGGFSLAAAAHNSVSIFIDDRGKDQYSGANPAQVSGNDYHGGYSLALFLDLGKGEDLYPEGYAQDMELYSNGQGFFVDRPVKSIQELLTNEKRPATVED